MSIAAPSLIAVLLSGAAAVPPGDDAGQAQFAREVRPLLEQRCFACHGGGKDRGGIALDGPGDGKSAAAERELWTRVLGVLRDRSMPPSPRPPLAAVERERLSAWIERWALGVDCSRPDPGPVVRRRLNRAEYRNTVRDLLGVDVDAGADFPLDPSGHGFDTVGDVLSVPPVLLEKLLSAAGKAVGAALLRAEPGKPRRVRYALDALEVGYNARSQSDGTVVLTSVEEDDLAVIHTSLAGGEHVVRARIASRPDGDRPLEATFLLVPRGDVQSRDGGTRGERRVVSVQRREPQVYEARLTAPRGRNLFRLVFARLKDGLPPGEAVVWKKGPTQKGSILVEWLEVEEPDGDGLPPDSRVLRLLDRHRQGAAGDRDTARAVLADLLPRAFRRPVEPVEVGRFLDLAGEAWARGEGFEAGLRLALEAMLVSPQLLYRGELGAAPAGLVVPAGDFALASRLSYFLWSSLPDERLFELAARGELAANLAGEALRMLRDPRSQALVEDFAGQWLELRNLDAASPDPALFPHLDLSLRSAMRQETEAFFEHVLRQDTSVLDFLTADYSFANERLARHYGLEGVQGTAFRRVSLTGTPRRGVLTHASVLLLTSNPTRTSAVKRGKWILENLLGEAPPPPLPSAPPLEEKPGDAGGETLRERLEAHRRDPICASCHARLDPLGFALEGFDAIGAWRDAENGRPIDTRGALADGTALRGTADLLAYLAGARGEDFARCLTEKMLVYALGRGLVPADRCAVDAIVARLRAGEPRFSSLVLGIVESAPFRLRRGAQFDLETESRP